MRREFNGFFIIKQIEKPWLCSVLLKSTQEAVRALKNSLPLHLFRALTASCVLYNRTKHSQSFSIC